MNITGKKLFVKALKAEGVDTIFAYPGGMVTDILDEIDKQGGIRIILPRHEQALIHAAEGYARATGKTAVCLVTSGPGATNTITGLTDAFYDSIPMVCFTGQVARNLVGNDAFQEVDMVGLTRNITKYSVMVQKREDMGRIIKDAFYIARTGKPGPVVIDIPKDIQVTNGDPEYPENVDIRGYKPPEGVHVGQLKKAWKTLKSAKRPLILAGGGVLISGAQDELQRFMEETRVPVVTTVMGRGAVPTYHPYYVGDAGLHGSYSCNQAIAACDVLFSIGTRFNDRITGSLQEFAPNAQIVHIDIDSASISRNVVVNVPIVADAKVALEKLLEWAEPIETADWRKMIQEWDNKYPMSMPNDVGLTPQAIIEGINEVFEKAIITTDVGQHQMWASQFLELDANKKMITSGGFGTMGFGFPAAVGAKIARPEMSVVSITGDGGFQMNMQEMATSVIEHAPVVVVLMNNMNLGMVRQMQNVYYGKRYVATSLKLHEEDVEKGAPIYVPDFVKWADSYGVEGIRITEREQIIPALQKAKEREEQGMSTLLEFLINEDELVLPMVKAGKGATDMIL